MDIIFSQDGKLSSKTFPENTKDKCQILKTKPNTKKWMETLFPYSSSWFFGSLLFVSLSTDHDDHYFHHGHGYPAYSHHDKIPPWWGNVSNNEGGNVPVSKNHHTPL